MKCPQCGAQAYLCDSLGRQWRCNNASGHRFGGEYTFGIDNVGVTEADRREGYAFAAESRARSKANAEEMLGRSRIRGYEPESDPDV